MTIERMFYDNPISVDYVSRVLSAAVLKIERQIRVCRFADIGMV